jgi:predicted nucleic acid-binding protein
LSDRPLPADVYLDTSIVIATIFPGTTNSTACEAFSRRLAAERCQIFFSQILRLELSEAIRKLATRPDRIPNDLRTRFQLDEWNQSLFVRHRWMQNGLQRFAMLLESFREVVELSFDEEIWRSSVTTMADEQLRSHDAIHVATARSFGVACIAAADDHFRRIKDIDVRLIWDTPAERN